MEQVPSDPDPLVERVAIAHHRLMQLIAEIHHDPPTPGVVDSLLQSLAQELDRGADALRRTAGPVPPLSIAQDLERHARDGKVLADAYLAGEVRREALAPRLDKHLHRELELASKLSSETGRSPASWADEYSRARDQVVYGL